MPITASHTKTITQADWTGTVTCPGSTGGTSTVVASNLNRPSDWNSTNHATTLSLTGSEITNLFSLNNGLVSSTNASGITIGQQNCSFYEPFVLASKDSNQSSIGSLGQWILQPFLLSQGIGQGRINVFVNRSVSADFLNGASFTANSTWAFSATALDRACLAIYSQGTGANVTRLESIWTGECAISATRSLTISNNVNVVSVSNYLTLGMISQIDTSGGTTSTAITASGLGASVSSAPGSACDTILNAAKSWYTGSVMRIVPFNTTLPEGPYWMGYMAYATSGGVGTTGANMATLQTYFNPLNDLVLGQQDIVLSNYRRLGGGTTINASTQPIPFFGVLATTTSNASAVIAQSDIASYSSFNLRFYWNYVQDTK